MLSATLNRAIARAIFDSLYAHSPQGDVLPPSARVDGDTAAGLHAHFLGQNLFPTDNWTGAAPASPVPPETEDVAALFHARSTPVADSSPPAAPPLLRLSPPRPLRSRRSPSFVRSPPLPLYPIPESEPSGLIGDPEGDPEGASACEGVSP